MGVCSQEYLLHTLKAQSLCTFILVSNILIGAYTLHPDGLGAKAAGSPAWWQSELEQVTQPHLLKFLSVKWKTVGPPSGLSKTM